MKPFTLCFLLSCIIVPLEPSGTATGQSQLPGQGIGTKRSETPGLRDTRPALPDGAFPHSPFDQNLGLTQKRSPARSDAYLPDTVVERTTQDTSRHVYTFNSIGRRIVDLIQHYRSGTWVDSLRQTTSFDATGKCLSQVSEVAAHGQFQQSYRIIFTYDGRGNLITELGQLWSYQWVDYRRTSYTYDGNDRLLTRLEELYTGGLWVYNSHSAYTYDAAGHILTHYEFSSWSNGTWRNGDLYTYTYDSHGRMATSVYTMWSGTNWEDRGSTSYAYHDNGHLLSELTQVRKYGSWNSSERVTYAYDPNWNLISKAIEGDNGGWTNIEWMTFYYDVSGRMTAELWQRWQSDHWENDIRWNYVYDTHGNLTAMSFDRWSNSIWTPDNTSLNFTDGAGNDCAYFGYTVTLTYSIVVTDVRPSPERECSRYSLLQNYPNPFNPTTTIRYELPERSSVVLTVYDTIGQLVKTLVNESEEAGSHEVKFDGSNLASGTYFYRLQAGSFVKAMRFLLVR